MHVPTGTVQTTLPWTAWAAERIVISFFVFSFLWLTARIWRNARRSQRMALGDVVEPPYDRFDRAVDSFRRQALVFNRRPCHERDA